MTSLPASGQIARQLRTAIESGEYGPGDRLPSQPELASRYGVARETVKAALRLLRNEGLIVSQQGSGTFVNTDRPPVATADDRAELDALIAHLGVPATLAILRAVKAAHPAR